MPFRLVGQKPSLAFDRKPKASLREVIRSPLHQYGGELVWHQGPKQREVLLHQLLLQADGVRTDDDLLTAIPKHTGDRRDEIGEALSGAGPRFDNASSTAVAIATCCGRDSKPLSRRATGPSGASMERAGRIMRNNRNP
jgi:hypothetical protein